MQRNIHVHGQEGVLLANGQPLTIRYHTLLPVYPQIRRACTHISFQYLVLQFASKQLLTYARADNSLSVHITRQQPLSAHHATIASQCTSCELFYSCKTKSLKPAQQKLYTQPDFALLLPSMLDFDAMT